MKISKTKLKQIIKEEISAVVNEIYSITNPPDKFGGSHRDTTGAAAQQAASSARPPLAPDDPGFKDNEEVIYNGVQGKIKKVWKHKAGTWVATIDFGSAGSDVNPEGFAIATSLLTPAMVRP